MCHRRVRQWEIRWSDTAARSTSPDLPVNSVEAAGGSEEYVQAYNFSKMIVAPTKGVRGVWVEGNSLPISDRIPRVDIRWWHGFLSQNMHGAAIRRVPLATSDITEMVHFAAPDTPLARWCSRAYCMLAFSLSRGLSRATGYYTEMTLKFPQHR